MQHGCNGPCKGAVVALRARPPGRSSRWCPRRRTTRTCWPATTPTSRRRPGSRLRDDPNSPMLLNRAISEPPTRPGSTFKCRSPPRPRCSGKFTEDSQLTAAPRITLPDSSTTLENYGGTPCGTGPTASLREAFAALLQHRVRPSSARSWAPTRSATQADAFRSAWRTCRRSRCRSPPSTVGPDPGRRRAAAVEHRPEGRRADARCRTRWSPPRSRTAAGDAPYLVDGDLRARTCQHRARPQPRPAAAARCPPQVAQLDSRI